LINAATLAVIGARRITQMSDIRNVLGELRRITLPRSSVNTASQPEHINVHAAGSRDFPALACGNLGRAHWQS
jgi:hypothetical protein